MECSPKKLDWINQFHVFRTPLRLLVSWCSCAVKAALGTLSDDKSQGAGTGPRLSEVTDSPDQEAASEDAGVSRTPKAKGHLTLTDSEKMLVWSSTNHINVLCDLSF
jgi:hypothetical protein